MQKRRGEGVKRRGPRRALDLAILLLFIAPQLPGQGATGVAAAGRAILVKGSNPIRGLPFFSPNAIPALTGEYAIGGSGIGTPIAPASPGGQASELLSGEERIRVWYTRETLVFGASWRRTEIAALSAYLLPRFDDSRGGSSILALATSSYTLFIQVPEDRPSYRSFAVAFERRFSVFFSNAKDDAELSFPAFVDFPTSPR